MSDTEQPTTVKLDLEVSVEAASECKQEGNDHFRAKRWDDALATYRSALAYLPKRSFKKEVIIPSNEPGSESDDVDSGESLAKNRPEESQDGKDNDTIVISTPEVEQEEKEIQKLRAVINGNIGACLIKLGQHKEAVEVCSTALLDDPTYVKALERRASCNDILGTWSGLTAAQEDYTKLLTLITSASQQLDIRKKLQALKPRLESAQKKETDEMLGKLKGLGDSLLGNFGLSTDNFKFVPNEQGGYSVNFTR
ncbi:hypothetical protein CPB83DRAFT_842423 [Crepidotus variabilis]|uniref:Tetratricopeptide repeat protein 1 n=1 Tax=Crepidotus variabilis TaxID=179855 RepID=A0A9P6JX90_9AGAR|nr:hypothetical protein CPB83DRAFT_842423 [Crepidotus variabilis]